MNKSLKRKIGIVYIGKTFNTKRLRYCVPQSVRALIDILSKDPDNDIYLLTRNQLDEQTKSKVKTLNWKSMSHYNKSIPEQEVYDIALYELLTKENALEFETVFISGEPTKNIITSIGSKNQTHFVKRYVRTYQYTFSYEYTPFTILEFVKSKRFIVFGDDIDFIRMPNYIDKSKEDITYLYDFYANKNFLEGNNDKFVAYDIMNRYKHLDKTKKRLFTFGFYAKENRLDIYKNFIKKLDGCGFNIHLRISDKKGLFENHPFLSEIDYEELLPKLAQSKYSLCIDTVNDRKGLTTRPYLNWSLDVLTFFYDYDTTLRQIHSDLEYFRVKNAEELMRKILELENDPVLKQYFWEIIHTNYLNKNILTKVEEKWQSIAKGIL